MNTLDQRRFADRFLGGHALGMKINHGVTVGQIDPADLVGLDTITNEFRREIKGIDSDDIYWIIWRLRYLWRQENAKCL